MSLRDRLFARQPIEAFNKDSASSPMPRTLSTFSLTCFGVSSTIGAGIFVLTGVVAAEHAGPAVILTFVLAGFACALAGLCYAEFASIVPVAGSAYTYAYATLGELTAWVIGWCLILEYLFAGAMVAIGWAGYALAMAADFGLHVPAALAQAPFDVGANGLVMTGGLFNLPAVAVVLVCTLLVLAGTQLSARINDLIVVAKVLAILIIGIVGLHYVDVGNWTPFIPDNTGSFGEFGLSGLVTGAAIVFYAYIGFDTVSSMSQETRDAQRAVPRALILTLVICTVLYVLISLMVTGLMDYRQLSVADPVYVALDAAGPALSWAKTTVGIVVVVGLISTVLVGLLGQARIFYAMGRDGLLPPMFAAVHPRSRVPLAGTLFTGIGTALIAGVFPLKLLGELISIGTLLAFAIVCIGVIVLRRRNPELARPFRVPGYPWVPIGGVLVCVALMASLPADTWWRLVVWLLLGFAAYAAYGFKHSRLRRGP